MVASGLSCQASTAAARIGAIGWKAEGPATRVGRVRSALRNPGGVRQGPAGTARHQVATSLRMGARNLQASPVRGLGSLLGPGFATRNPYAGFWLLPLAVATVGNIGYEVLLAAAIGAAHDTGRALWLLRDVKDVDVDSYLQSTLRSMYWRMADGFILLAAAGAGAMRCAHRL